MKRCNVPGICFLFGLTVSALVTAGHAVAGEPLPDASVLAYRGGPKPPKPQPQPKISEVTLTGRITEVQPTGMWIKAGTSAKSKDQKQWYVQAQSGAEFTIHGTAEPEYLKTGQTIEFSGQVIPDEKTDTKSEEKTADKAKEEKAADKADEKPVDKADEKAADKAKEEKSSDKADEKATDKAAEKGAKKPSGEKVADKVDTLTIVSRKGGSAHKADAKDHAVDPATARIAAAKDADSDAILTAPTDSDSKAGKGGKPAAKHSGPKESISGRIATHDDKGFVVTIGNRTIRADLADIPKINVELSFTDPKVIVDTKDKSKSRIEGKSANGKSTPILFSDLEGSTIVVHGTGAELKQAAQCAAKSIEVTLAKPLSGKPSAKKSVPSASSETK